MVKVTYFIFIKIYLFICERERAHEQGGGVEGKADSPPTQVPNVGLDPRTLGS